MRDNFLALALTADNCCPQASFLSAVTLLSTPTEIYSFGTMYSFFGLTYISALPIAAYMFMPTFYRLRLISGYEVKGKGRWIEGIGRRVKGIGGRVKGIAGG